MKIALTKTGQSGSTILIAIATTVILGSFVALAVDYTSNIGRNAQRDRVFNTAVEIGDGCLELSFASWRELSKTAENPASSAFAAMPTPMPAHFPSFTNATITNFKVQAVDPMITLSSDNPPTSALPTTTNPPKTTGPGSGTFSYFYLATVDVALPVSYGYQVGGADVNTVTAKVRRVFEKRYTSAWNWAMLYDGDLELYPDSPLALNGWVHSNKNVYVGNGTLDPASTPAPTLTLTDRLTYAGNYTVGYSPSDPDHTGHVNVQDAIAPADLPPGTEQVYSPFDITTTQFNTTDGNYNNDGYHELIERKSSSGSSADIFADKRLYDQAQLAVLIDGNNVTILWGTGASKTNITSSGGSSNGTNARSAVGNAVKPGYTLQDNREGVTMDVTKFDVAEFLNYYPSSTTKGWNGIVYIADVNSSSGSNNPGAIEIINGAKLPSGGMTIATENPAYIQGDFNTGRVAGTSEPPSNTGDPTDPDVSGYTRQPASVVADAVTLLSNNWNDSNSGAGLDARIASNTTVNAALLAGNVPSNGSDYSGGGENFVRLLEDWTGKSFTYYGSMICLYPSAQGTGGWGKDNVYLPASLNWSFDTTLSVDSSGNPVSVPGYVSTVAYLQQQRWYLQY